MFAKVKPANLKLFLSIVVVCTSMMLVYGYTNPLIGWNEQDFHIWQLLTAHLMHYDLKHLLSNMLALGLLLFLFPASFKSNVIGIVFAIILIDLYLWLSQIEYYVGYSGLLYTIPGLAFAKNIYSKRYKHIFFIIIAYGLYVFISRDTVNYSNEIMWRPLHQAHLMGFIGGMFAMLVFKQSHEYSECMGLNTKK